MAELRKETAAARMDAETEAALRQLDTDIHRLLDPGQETPESEPLIERARQLEADFAAKHPVFEGFMREVVDALVKIGV